MMRAGRLHAPTLDALVEPRALRAPGPGAFVPAIALGDLVTAGATIGELVVLGRPFAIIVPRRPDGPATLGIAIEPPTTTRAVGYGDLLVAFDPSLPVATDALTPAGPARTSVAGLVFRAPTSGRFYGRPTPDKPPFVAPGTQLAPGVTICLLEVMKTFHRVTYGGHGLPDTARVLEILVADGDDVNADDPLLALET
jgi:acetyl-CoA carboxylase biotin carboxyl carrier protein